MAEPEAVWRVCRVIKGDCDFCPASEMVGGGACARSCFAQAVECINTVETGNPWRKTEGVKAPWISASPAPEGGEEEGLGSASASGDDGAVSFAAANHEVAPTAADAASQKLLAALKRLMAAERSAARADREAIVAVRFEADDAAAKSAAQTEAGRELTEAWEEARAAVSHAEGG